MRRTIIILSCCCIAIGLALCLHGCAPAIAAGGGAATAIAGVAVFEYIASSEITQEVLSYAGKEAAIFGLKKIPASEQQAAANALNEACDDVLKYLRSGTLPLADIVNQIITAKFKAAHPLILAEIQVAAYVLGKVVPSANVALSQAEIADLIAFVGGIQQGAQTFLVNPNVTMKQKYTKPHKMKMTVDADGYVTEQAFPDWFNAK